MDRSMLNVKAQSFRKLLFALVKLTREYQHNMAESLPEVCIHTEAGFTFTGYVCDYDIPDSKNISLLSFKAGDAKVSYIPSACIINVQVLRWEKWRDRLELGPVITDQESV